MHAFDVSAALAAFLTKLNDQDPRFIRDLVDHRALVNNESLDVVCPFDPQGVNRANAVGVLNGFLDSIGQPRIAWTEEEDGRITEFAPLCPTWNSFEVGGVEVQVEPEVPAGEVAALKALLEAKLGLLVTNYRARISKLPEGVDVLLVSAPGIPAYEVEALRVHLDEALKDPDYKVVTNYLVEVSGR